MDNKPQVKSTVSHVGKVGDLSSGPAVSERIGGAETVLPISDVTLDQRLTSSVDEAVFTDLATGLSTPTGRVSKPKPGNSIGLESLSTTKETFVGNYEVLSVLGKGGMGVVYKARHRRLNRVVALKMIQNGLQGGSTAIERFLLEAQVVAALQHPGIIQIFEIGEHLGRPYLCLEYVEGQDLLSSLKGQPWAAKPAAELVASLCEAMQYAHENRVLHRDIKPSNILLDSKNRGKISDFGIARMLEANDSATVDGAVVGTPSYMPPEQARGDTAAISARSDVYSLGAVLYQIVTGRAPFVSDSVLETLEQVVHCDPLQPRVLKPDLPIDLESICMKALQKDPDNRYQSCADLASDLRRYLRGEAVLARPIGRWQLLARWCRHNPWIAWPTAVASFFVVATAIVSLAAWQITASQANTIAAERDEANEQRKEADKQKLIANQQQAMADEKSELAIKQANLALQNIQFFLTDIDTKLSHQSGTNGIRLEMLESISKKWDELDLEMVGGIRGKAIPTLMRVRHHIALAFSQLDRVKDADNEFTKLEKVARERIVLKEGIDAARLNLAKILMTGSLIQRQVDNVIGAEGKLVEAQNIVQGIIKQPKPDDTATDLNEVHQVLSAIHQNLGTEYLRQGRVEDAAIAFAKSVESNQAVLENIESQPGYTNLEPSVRASQTSELKCAIDKGTIGLAYVLLRLGKTDEAIAKYDIAIAGRRSELKKNPLGYRNQTELAQQLSLYGRSLLWIRRVDEAVPILNEAVKLCNEALGSDPEKAELKRALASSLFAMGTLRDLQGNPDEALGHFERSRGLRADLYKSSPDSKNGVNLMRSEARVGNSKVAKELSDEFGQATKPNAEAHLDRACALAQAARALQGDEHAAFIDEALTSLERSIAEGYMDPFRVSKDLDLLPLHNEPRFIAVRKQLETPNPAVKK
jgi:eukaryotic-like serine/threonine-protein kinase